MAGKSWKSLCWLECRALQILQKMLRYFFTHLHDLFYLPVNICTEEIKYILTQ